MQDRLTDEQISTAFQRALSTPGLIDREEDTSVIFYDLTHLHDRVRGLKSLFPPDSLHAIAIKANPLEKVLTSIENLGVGLEAASLPELHIALNAGYPPERIVFDSPAKTVKELDYALSVGVHVNADSLPELERIDALLRNKASVSTVGVRINPQVGAGTISKTSVAERGSKFGVPLERNRAQLKECFDRYSWLTGVHVHIGSQGCPVDLLLKGVRAVYDFATEVNTDHQRRGTPNRVPVFDIGGGLPVSYERGVRGPDMAAYVDELKKSCPDIFGPGCRLITEFGRHVHANAGWVASRVEYVKEGDGVDIAVIHVGADLFLRECYNPQDWHHEIAVVDAEGRLKQGTPESLYDIAGPLCFSGDLLARRIQLPQIVAGDYITIEDSGAYTSSMWSTYNSRQFPKVVGYENGGKNLACLRQRQTVDEVLRFWSKGDLL